MELECTWLERTRLALLVALLGLSGCSGPATRGRLIELYSRLECVPVRFGPGISPPTRAWNHVIHLEGALTAHIHGEQMPGGRIEVTFEPGGDQRVAANAGDYIWPADVRLDLSNRRLYVRGSGHPAVSTSLQTWLIEYDLRERREIERLLVDPKTLPEVCPLSK